MKKLFIVFCLVLTNISFAKKTIYIQNKTSKPISIASHANFYGIVEANKRYDSIIVTDDEIIYNKTDPNSCKWQLDNKEIQEDIIGLSYEIDPNTGELDCYYDIKR